MSKDSVKIGIDYRDGQYFAARVDNEGGRPEVKALLRFDKEHFQNHPLLKASRFIFSIPDDKVILKKITIDPAEPDFDLRANFELSQRIMEDEKNCYFDTIATSLEKKYIGLILRKKYLDEITGSLNFDNHSNGLSTGGEMKAAAMAKGYLNFCQLTEGELVCLTDFGKTSVSIAFIYQNNILDLSFFPIDKLNISHHDNFEKIVIELKTLINFKLVSFFDDGITIPLSTLSVMGNKLDDKHLSILSRFFQSKVQKPVIHSGFFSPQSNLSQIPLEKYLTALGLTVN